MYKYIRFVNIIQLCYIYKLFVVSIFHLSTMILQCNQIMTVTYRIIDFMVPKIINFIVSRYFIIISVFHNHIVSIDLIRPIIIKLFFREKTTPILTHTPFTTHYGTHKRHTKFVSNHRVVETKEGT